MLADKTAVITGAGRNVGEGIARTFAEHGASVAVNDVDEERAQRVVDGLAADDGQRHRRLVCDATDPGAVGGAAAELEADYGTVDVLVNNLGYAVNKGVFDTSVEEWHAVVDRTLTSVFLWTKHVGPLMVDDGGAVINLGSGLGHHGQTEKTAYCAAKAGVINMTRQLALDLAEHDVRVNSISPGLVGDPVGTTGGPEGRDPGRIPLGRIGEPADVGKAAVFLASPLADYVTGADLEVDGGYK